MIQVTKPFIPPIIEYNQYLKQIWERNWLTNNGPLVNNLELALKKILHIQHLLYVSNGTIALQLALKALEVKNEVITTPFSYVATTTSIIWEDCIPIFVDIESSSWNIDVTKIEAAITPKTTAILATHVFGNPCQIEMIKHIADKYNLSVIYDAAHCFGVEYNKKSIFNYGDISTTSFHATKLFHTIEGGAIITQSSNLLKKLSLLRNFGHDGFENFSSIGINAKNSEFHAAMGLCNIKYINSILAKRKQQYIYYLEKLKKLNVSFQVINETCTYNYAYFPILFNQESHLLLFKEKLESHRIFCRRYFYPSLNLLPYLKNSEMPISENISSRILCLPMYHTMTKEIQDFICRILLRIQNYHL